MPLLIQAFNGSRVSEGCRPYLVRTSAISPLLPDRELLSSRAYAARQGDAPMSRKFDKRIGRAIDRIAKSGGRRAAARYARAIVRGVQRAGRVRSGANMARIARFAGSTGRSGLADPSNIWKEAMDAMVTNIILGNGYYLCGGPSGVLDHGDNGSETCGENEIWGRNQTWDTSGLRPNWMVWRQNTGVYQPGSAGRNMYWQIVGKWRRYDEALGPNIYVRYPGDAIEGEVSPPRDKSRNYVPPYVRPELARPGIDAPTIPVPYKDIPKRKVESVSHTERTHRGLYNPSWGPVVWVGPRSDPWVRPFDRPDWPARPKPVTDKDKDKPTSKPKPTDKPIVGVRPGTGAVAAPANVHEGKGIITRAAWETLNVYGGWTELRDLVNAVYKALPAERRRWERKARYDRKLTWSEKAAILYEHYDEIDLGRAVLEILQANLTDAASAWIAKPGDKVIAEMFPNLGERLAARGLAKQLADAMLNSAGI